MPCFITRVLVCLAWTLPCIESDIFPGSPSVGRIDVDGFQECFHAFLIKGSLKFSEPEFSANETKHEKTSRHQYGLSKYNMYIYIDICRTYYKENNQYIYINTLFIFILSHWGSFQNLTFKEHIANPVAAQVVVYDSSFSIHSIRRTSERWAMCRLYTVSWCDLKKTRHNRLRTEKPWFLFLLKGTNCLSVCLFRSNNIGGHGHWYKHNSTRADKDRKASRPRLIHSLVDAKKSQENWQLFFNAILNGFFVVELHDLIFAQIIANTYCNQLIWKNSWLYNIHLFMWRVTWCGMFVHVSWKSARQWRQWNQANKGTEL